MKNKCRKCKLLIDYTNITQNEKITCNICKEKTKLKRESENLLRRTNYKLTSKKCKKCEIIKELNKFCIDKKMIGGRQNVCKECNNKKLRAKYIPIPTTKERKEYNKQYYKINSEKIKIDANNWYSENKDKRYISNKNYAKQNKLKINSYHKKYQPQYRKDRMKNDLNYRLSMLLRHRFKDIVKAKNKHKSALKLVGCEVNELKNYLEKLFLVGMSWENHGQGNDKWNIDHIVPCSHFDLTKLEEQIKCFHFTNLAPLWQKDNQSKHDKLPSDYTLGFRIWDDIYGWLVVDFAA